MAGPNARIHNVFLGHEGSIFGVHISKELELVPERKRQRLLASCSDDRTIRVWDVSIAADTGSATTILDEDLDAQRTRHTGFSNGAFDSCSSGADCLATGWGHGSRVWTVQFLDPHPSTPGHFLLSTGEDATSRIWRLATDEANSRPSSGPHQFNLSQINTSLYHSGKNIWSVVVLGLLPESQQIACGAADSKITTYPLSYSKISQDSIVNGYALEEYNMGDIITMAQGPSTAPESQKTISNHKSSRMTEFFRSYSFTDDSSFLLTTNSGNVYLGSISARATDTHIISNSRLLDHLEDLSGYSVCVGETSIGIGYVAGSQGNIYAYQKDSPRLHKIHSVNGKVGNMFTSGTTLLVTVLGKREAHLLRINCKNVQEPQVSKVVTVWLSEQVTGLIITSMAYIATAPDIETDFVFLGYRKGSIARYCITKHQINSSDPSMVEVAPRHILQDVHGKETVTTLNFIPSRPLSSYGHLLSAGRDGSLAIHYGNFGDHHNTPQLVHRLALPFGTNIEGLYHDKDSLIVCGFSSTKFISYNMTTEEEIISVDTGGAHRSWAFQPGVSARGGGTLVWTRASSMHVYTQNGPNHEVIRSGGHGREIKAVASCTVASEDSITRQLIATGAEDTDIKIFEYLDEEFVCRRTLQKHTTGIQHLQWSDDGKYLFSSGGCEEFYIWRVRILPGSLGVGVVCESVHVPQSEHPDLRITAFDVWRQDEAFIIAMVFSDSTIRVCALQHSSTSLSQMLLSNTIRYLHTQQIQPPNLAGKPSPRVYTLHPATHNAYSYPPPQSSQLVPTDTQSFGPLQMSHARLTL